MQNDSVEIDGKIFISSKRASRKYGYTMDYLGQLARSGKILSKLFGRNRFIDEESLIQYQNILLGVVQPKITESILQNKEISDIRDEQFTPENVEISSEIAKNIEPEEVVQTIEIRQEEVVEPVQEKPQGSTFATPAFTPVSTIQNEFLTSQYGVLVHERFPTFLLFGLISIAFLWTTLMFTGATFSYSTTHPESKNSAAVAEFFSKEKFGELTTTLDRNLFASLDSIQAKIFHDSKSFADFIRSLFADQVVVVQGGPNSNTKPSVTGVSNSTTTNNTTVFNQTIDSEELRRAISEVLDERGVVTVEALANNTVHSGVVTIPSTGDQTKDELLRQKVANSFSDQVTVTLDPSRTTGVVQPIFKNAARSDDYMFVLVPVKE